MSGGLTLAPEHWTFEELVLAGWSEADLAWERALQRAVEALAAGAADEAREHFAEAVRIAHAAFPPDDPRLGTSLANHGAALVAAGEAHSSGRSLADARRIWAGADAWLGRMTAPRVARSSLFHMRMEQRHRSAYEARWRAKWADLSLEAQERMGANELTLAGPDEAAEQLGRWQRERPAMLNDTRKLMAAVILLVCRPASIFAMTPRRSPPGGDSS